MVGSFEPLLLIRSHGPHALLPRLELLQVLHAHAVYHDILRFGHQNLPPPKGHQGKEKQDEPGDADEDDHDDMPSVERRKVKDVSKSSDSRNESDVGECQGPACTKAQLVDNKNIVQKTRRARTSKDFGEVLVYLEPVRQCTKDEKEHGKTKEHDPRHDAGRIPHLACLRRNKTV